MTATPTETAPPPAQETSNLLTLADRCDKCGAQAWVRTESRYSTLALDWCAHHFTEYEAQGFFTGETHVITDERPKLLAAVKAQAEYTEGDAK